MAATDGHPTITLRFPYEVLQRGSYVLRLTVTTDKLSHPAKGERDYAKAPRFGAINDSPEVFVMSTMLRETPTHWLVSIVAGPGSRRKIPRMTVRVLKGDKALRKEVIISQANRARALVLPPKPTAEPVV